MTTEQQTTWYATKSAGNHQGVIADEQTGRTVAISYDVKDTPLLAAAPDLLAACEELTTAFDGETECTEILELIRIGPIRHAILKAKGQDL